MKIFHEELKIGLAFVLMMVEGKGVVAEFTFTKRRKVIMKEGKISEEEDGYLNQGITNADCAAALSEVLWDGDMAGDQWDVGQETEGDAEALLRDEGHERAEDVVAPFGLGEALKLRKRVAWIGVPCGVHEGVRRRGCSLTLMIGFKY